MDDLTKQLLQALVVTRLALEYCDKSKPPPPPEIESAKALADAAIQAGIKEGLERDWLNDEL